MQDNNIKYASCLLYGVYIKWLREEYGYVDSLVGIKHDIEKGYKVIVKKRFYELPWEPGHYNHLENFLKKYNLDVYFDIFILESDIENYLYTCLKLKDEYYFKEQELLTLLKIKEVLC